MKWFKHYTNAHKGQTLQNLYLHFGKPTGYGLYFLFVGYLTDIWDGEREPEFVVSVSELSAYLGIKRFKIGTFLECFENIPGTFPEHSENKPRMKWELNENILRISFPKLLEIRHRDAISSGQRREIGGPESGLDEKKRKNNSNTKQLGNKRPKKKLTPVQFNNYVELIDSLPTELKDSWNEYDTDWLVAELEQCFLHYTVLGGATPASLEGWHQKASGWIARSRNKVLKNKTGAGSISGLAVV